MAQVKVTVVLSQKAQEQALRDGHPAQEVQVFESDDRWAIIAVLDAGGSIGSDGSVHLQFGRLYDNGKVTYDSPRLDVRPKDLVHALSLIHESEEDRRRAQEQKEHEEAEERLREIAEWAKKPVQERVSWNYRTDKCVVDPPYGICPEVLEKTVPEAYAEAVAEATRRQQEWEESRQREQEKLDQNARAEQERAASRLKRLAALARDYGDRTVRERLAEGEPPLGLLPEDEALTIARDAFLPLADGLEARERLAASEINHADDCYESSGHVRDPREAESLTAPQWRAVSAVRARLPKTVDRGRVMERSIVCGNCAVGYTIHYLRVEHDCGDGLFVAREYALKE